LKDWIDESNIAQPYQGDGLKRHTKKHYNANKWILHAKAYAKKHKVPYNIALKEAKTSYK
jgi:hypothetical protein